MTDHLKQQVQGLKQSSAEKEQELQHVRQLVGGLQVENSQLHCSSSRQKGVIIGLQAQVRGVFTLADEVRSCPGHRWMSWRS